MVLLTQYISIILSHPICGMNIKCNVKIINEVFGIFFLTKSLKSSVYFTLTTRPSSDATCQMLGSHVWLLTTDWTENQTVGKGTTAWQHSALQGRCNLFALFPVVG